MILNKLNNAPIQKANKKPKKSDLFILKGYNMHAINARGH
jgi:hypothetical protein